MQNNIEKDRVLYDIDEGIIKEPPASTRVQFSEGLDSFEDTNNNVSSITDRISQNKQNVNIAPVKN